MDLMLEFFDFGKEMIYITFVAIIIVGICVVFKKR